MCDDVQIGKFRQAFRCAIGRTVVNNEDILGKLSDLREHLLDMLPFVKNGKRGKKAGRHGGHSQGSEIKDSF